MGEYEEFDQVQITFPKQQRKQRYKSAMVPNKNTIEIVDDKENGMISRELLKISEANENARQDL